MKKSLAFLAILLLLVHPAYAATWVSGTVASIEKYGDGQLLAVIVWTDDKGAQDKTSMVLPPLNATAFIQAELTRKNAADSAISSDLKVGTVILSAAAVVTVPSTDDIAASAFDVLVQAWRAAKGKNAISVTFGLQADIDAAAATVVSNYNKGTASQKARFDVALAMIQRVFP